MTTVRYLMGANIQHILTKCKYFDNYFSTTIHFSIPLWEYYHY